MRLTRNHIILSGNFGKIEPSDLFLLFWKKRQNRPRAIFPKLPTKPCDNRYKITNWYGWLADTSILIFFFFFVFHFSLFFIFYKSADEQITSLMNSLVEKEERIKDLLHEGTRHFLLKAFSYFKVFNNHVQQRCFNVHLTSITSKQRWIDVQKTSCACRVNGVLFIYIRVEETSSYVVCKVISNFWFFRNFSRDRTSPIIRTFFREIRIVEG